MEIRPRELLIYETEDGRCPFEEWLGNLRDVAGRVIIRKRLNRVRLGNMGDAKSFGDGVFELRIDYGPGYRIYFGEEGSTIVVLLIGGVKRSQSRDIQKAKMYWSDYHA